MNRLNLLLLFLLFALIIWAKTDVATKDYALVNLPIISPTVTPTPTPVVSTPEYFYIPKINVAAPIEPVGVDENGKMLLPSDITKVGWYAEGYKPGEKGNAVIAGHLDSTTGAGAIFYHLHELEPGDSLIVTDAQGKEYNFSVTKKEVYPFNLVPIEEVFGSNDKKNLNLITCTGWWNNLTHNYSHRMIIYATLNK